MTPESTGYVVVREFEHWSEPIAVYRSQEAAEAHLAKAKAARDEHDKWIKRQSEELNRRQAAGVRRGLCFPGPALLAEVEKVIGPEPPSECELAIYPVPMDAR